MTLWQQAMTYLDVPFRHRGRSRTGLDCAGLVICAAADLGVDLLDIKVYGREPWRDGLRSAIRANLGDPVDRDIQPDDILLMRLSPRSQPGHVAIVAPHPYGLGMIHTYGEIGRVAFHRIDEHRRNQIVEVYPWRV